MNMWTTGCYLVVLGLVVSSWALTPEECEPLIRPQSLEDPNVMLGRGNFLVGYTNNDVYNAILKLTESSWVQMNQSESDTKTIVMAQENRVNGTCLASKTNATINGDTVIQTLANVTSMFQLLPSCEGCTLYNIKSTNKEHDISKLLELMNIDVVINEGDLSVHALYLLSRESTLKDSDLEHFKQQASCLGFSGEPDFLYDPKNAFCNEGEGIDLLALKKNV